MLTGERIRGRVVDIEVGEVPGIGWVAVGIVTHGAERRLKMEIEAAFA